VTATNRDLAEAVADGTFREDLFYRLNVIMVELPPLRSRMEDLPLLVAHFLERFCNENGKPMMTLNGEAMRALMDYQWPGNVRELENVIERAVVLASGSIITPDLIPDHILGRTPAGNILEERPDASLFDIVEECERRIIVGMLEKCNWNQTEAAERFRVPLSTLNQKIKRLIIDIKKKYKD
jgi:DNA-binding NtrC family response regulator